MKSTAAKEKEEEEGGSVRERPTRIGLAKGGLEVVRQLLDTNQRDTRTSIGIINWVYDKKQ